MIVINNARIFDGTKEIEANSIIIENVVGEMFLDPSTGGAGLAATAAQVCVVPCD